MLNYFPSRLYYKLQNIMKKNLLMIVAVALVGAATLTLNPLRAQNDAAQSLPPAVQNNPTPGPRPLPSPGARVRPGSNYRQVIMILKRTKMDLQRATDDYDGHRQSALDACDKAVQELEAVQTSIQAKAAAAAAAAQQAPAPAPAPTPTPAPAQ